MSESSHRSPIGWWHPPHPEKPCTGIISLIGRFHYYCGKEGTAQVADGTWRCSRHAKEVEISK